jgi:hypothetical protein
MDLTLRLLDSANPITSNRIRSFFFLFLVFSADEFVIVFFLLNHNYFSTTSLCPSPPLLSQKRRSKYNTNIETMTGTNGNGNGNGSARVGTSTVKQGLAQMLKGGVIVSSHPCVGDGIDIVEWFREKRYISFLFKTTNEN